MVSDLDAATRPGPVRRDHVLGIGGASVSLARAVVRAPVERALDLGTGCGIQALHLDAHCAEIVATDTNERALALAAGTARLNAMSWICAAACSSRWRGALRPDRVQSAVRRRRRRPRLPLPGFRHGRRCVVPQPDRTDTRPPDARRHAQVMANWIVRDGADWRDRVRTGWPERVCTPGWCSANSPTRSVTYRCGHRTPGRRPSRPRRGGEWLDWFAAEGITGIGMGIITLRAPRPGEHGAPDQVLEEITATGEALTGPEVEAFFARREYLRETTDDELLAARLSAAPVFLEETSLPGPEGWQRFRPSSTPGRPAAVVGVDEVSRALLAGCRGEVPLGTLIELATHHGVDAGALAAAACRWCARRSAVACSIRPGDLKSGPSWPGDTTLPRTRVIAVLVSTVVVLVAAVGLYGSLVLMNTPNDRVARPTPSSCSVVSTTAAKAFRVKLAKTRRPHGGAVRPVPAQGQGDAKLCGTVRDGVEVMRKAGAVDRRGEAIFTDRLATEHQWRRVVVVSWRYHLIRARLIFDQCASASGASFAFVAVPRRYLQTVAQFSPSSPTGWGHHQGVDPGECER